MNVYTPPLCHLIFIYQGVIFNAEIQLMFYQLATRDLWHLVYWTLLQNGLRTPMFDQPQRYTPNGSHNPVIYYSKTYTQTYYYDILKVVTFDSKK